MDPNLQQLVQYITEEMERGVPEQAVRATLAQQGWTAEWIEAGFNTVHVQPTLPSPRPDKGDYIVEKKGNRKRALLLLGLFGCIILAIGGGAYYVLSTLDNAQKQRINRDEGRRSDLATVLSDLSDYYVAHSSYPLPADMNKSDFLAKNGFDRGSLQDPSWNPEASCTESGQPVLSESVSAGCYAYVASTSQGAPCDNATHPCRRLSFSIWLEEEKQSYTVIFDQNTEIDE